MYTGVPARASPPQHIRLLKAVASFLLLEALRAAEKGSEKRKIRVATLRTVGVHSFYAPGDMLNEGAAAVSLSLSLSLTSS